MYEYVSQYSDLAEAERALVLDKFRHATIKWSQNSAVQSGIEGTEKEEQKSHMIVATDACLPLLASGESPISSSVLINYELPTKKVILYCNCGFIRGMLMLYDVLSSLAAIFI